MGIYLANDSLRTTNYQLGNHLLQTWKKPSWILVKACQNSKYFLLLENIQVSLVRNNVTKEKEKYSPIHKVYLVNVSVWTRQIYMVQFHFNTTVKPGINLLETFKVHISSHNKLSILHH